MFIRSYYDLDGDGFEYEINVSDGKHNLRCFADSKPNIGNGKVNLYATLILSIEKVNSNRFSISKTEDYFGYEIVAKVVDADLCLVRFFGYIMELGETLPQDVTNDDFILVRCTRIDCNIK